jgi:hypothetical protein
VRRIVRRLIVWYSVRNRRRKAALITDFMGRTHSRSLLLVGVGVEVWRNEAVVEHAVAGRAQTVIACDACEARPVWPFVRADARALPFRTRSIDFVLSNAVVEHVGQEPDQLAMIAEHRRVGRSWVVTTPNRWFLVESHSAAVLKHWSPKWRERQSKYFSRLLSRKEFARLLPPGTRVIGRPWASTFVAMHSEHSAA